MRKRNYEEIISIISSLEEAIKYSHDNFNSTDEKYIHILECDRQVYMNKALENQEHLEQIKKMMRLKPKFDELDINTEDLAKRALRQRESTDQIMSRLNVYQQKLKKKLKNRQKRDQTKKKTNKK